MSVGDGPRLDAPARGLTIAAQGADVVTIDVLEAAQKIAGVSWPALVETWGESLR
jgi:hypothetical protein